MHGFLCIDQESRLSAISNLPSATLGVECGEIRFRFFFSDGEQLSTWAAVFTEVEFVFSSSDESWTLSEYSIPMLASVRHSSIAIFDKKRQARLRKVISYVIILLNSWFFEENRYILRENNEVQRFHNDFARCTRRRGIYYSRQFSLHWIVGSWQFYPKQGRTRVITLLQ